MLRIVAVLFSDDDMTSASRSMGVLTGGASYGPSSVPVLPQPPGVLSTPQYPRRYGPVINILAGGRPLPPEILPPSDLPSPVNGILWEMSELVTQERIAVGSSNFMEGLNT